MPVRAFARLAAADTRRFAARTSCPAHRSRTGRSAVPLRHGSRQTSAAAEWPA